MKLSVFYRTSVLRTMRSFCNFCRGLGKIFVGGRGVEDMFSGDMGAVVKLQS